MLAPDVSIHGFSPEDLRLFGALTGKWRARAGLLVESREGRIVTVRRTDGEPARHVAGLPLAELARVNGVRWALRYDTTVAREIEPRLAATLIDGTHLLEQIAAALALLRELEAAGQIELWPLRADAVPRLSAQTLSSLLDLVCPAGRTVVLGAFEEGELKTGFAARRSVNGFDEVLGIAELRPAMGLVSGDWTRDYLYLVEVVEQRLSPLSLGVFAEFSTLQRLTLSRPGDFSRAVAARDVIVTPIAPLLAVPLGLDLGVSVVRRAREISRAFPLPALLLAAAPFAGAIDSLRSQLPAWESQLATRLGFDPIALARELTTLFFEDD